MVFLGYEARSKTYRLYDPVENSVHISRDVVFDEAANWNWSGIGADEGEAGSRSSFFFEHSSEIEDVGSASGGVERGDARGRRKPGSAEPEGSNGRGRRDSGSAAPRDSELAEQGPDSKSRCRKRPAG